MARPEKMNVEYFPHYISDGKKMSHLQKRFGNDGYATWFKMLEELAKADHHYLDLRDEIQVMFLSDKCDVSEQQLIEIVDILSRLGAFDQEMWSHRIVWSAKFNDSVQDAWKRRNTPLMSKDDVKDHLKIAKKRKSSSTTSKKTGKGASSERKIVYPWETETFMEWWHLWKEYKSKEFGFKYKSEISEQKALSELANMANGDEVTAIHIINQAIGRGWKGFYELKKCYVERNIKKAGGGNGSDGGKQSTVSKQYAQAILEDLLSE